MQNKDNPEISIILPTYNERENIIDLIYEISLYITNHVKRSFEIIVVDDDSPDRTWEAVQQQFSTEQRVKLIHRTTEKGLTSAILRGAQESKGRVIAWLDCDFSMPPYKLAELINRVFVGCDICVGSRFAKGGKDVRGPTDSWIAVILSWIMNHFIFIMLGHSFKDYTSGFIAVRREVLDDIKLKGDYGEYFIDFIYNAIKKKYKILEIPYYCMARRAGTSKTGSNLVDYLSRGWKYIYTTLRLRFTANSRAQTLR